MFKRKALAVVAVVAAALIGLAAPALASSHHRHHSSHRTHHHSSHADHADDSSGDTSSDDDGSGTDTTDDDAGTASGTVATGSAQTITARLTGYSYQDNTPPGSADISMPVLHQKAGGTGTYADPITTAVPGSGGKGAETPKGTRIYVAKLKRYFIVEDTGASSAGQKHFDLWVGGQGFSKSASDKCMNSYTGSAPVILNPAPGLPVTVGPLTGANGCRI